MSALFCLPLRLRPARVVFALPGMSGSQCQPRRSSSTAKLPSPVRGREYGHAVALLESLQSNRAVVGSILSSSRDMNLDAIPEMIEWTRKAGYEVEDLHKHGLRCIHVAGTKGKGSVCAMTENILLQYRAKDSKGEDVAPRGLGKIGLYTSPHLVDVRERIRIDGAPISKDIFAFYFFQLWDRFSEVAGQERDRLSPTGKPGFFRFLTIMAFHAFIQEGVQTAIIECGIGGEYDSTNILPKEAVTVTAITKLGIDHVGMLGDTIERIAWHKSGIMKAGVPAYTVPQVEEAQEVLENRATEKGANLTVVERIRAIENGDVKLGLGGEFQVGNASLAVAVATSHLRALDVSEDIPQTITTTVEMLPSKFAHGLKTVAWPGRCQIISDGNIEWYVDGAHTIDSIIAAADWFTSSYLTAMQSPTPPNEMMLIFNQQDRDATELMRTLMNRLSSLPVKNALMKRQIGGGHSEKPLLANLFGRFPVRVFRYAAFCTNDPFPDQKEGAKPRDLTLQRQLARVYTSLDGNDLTMTYGSIEEAVVLAHRVAKGHEKLFVFVTGSLHLVGGLLKVLERRRAEEASRLGGCDAESLTGEVS